MFKKIALKYLLLMIFIGCSIQFSDCTSNQECEDKLTANYICNSDRFCELGDFTFSAVEVIGLAIIASMITITNVGGVGAGSVIVPTTMAFLDYTVTDAIPYARVTIMTGCLVSFAMTGFARSKSNPNRLDISYNLAASVVPLLLSGSQIGVILTLWIPRVVIGVLLTCYLLISLRKTYISASKGTKKIKEKTLLKENKREVELQSYTEGIQHRQGSILDSSNTINIKTKFQLIRENAHNLAIIMLCLGLLVIASLFRGGHKVKSIIGLQYCGVGGWLVVAISQVTAVLISAYTYNINKASFTAEDVGLDSTESLSASQGDGLHLLVARHLIFASFAIGIVAGMLGIGGGLVISVYMVAMGLNIGSIASFSIFIVLVSSTSSTLQFIIAGDLKIQNSYEFIAAALIGSLIANTIIRPLIERNKKSNAVLWLLFVALCISYVVLPLVLIERVFHNPKSEFSFGQLC
jgi:uncharacterized membrane protein YfcA